MKILLLGLSYKTAPIEVREQLSFTPTMLRSALTHFDTNHSQAHLQDVREGVILSTCNRLEVYALVHNANIATEAIINFLAQSCNISPDSFRDHLYIYQDDTAVNHLLRVTAGLDSMVLGEPQILGQVTEAFQAALAQAAAGTVLSALFRAAIHTGKRVRSETAIALNATSISSVAAGLAGQLWTDLTDKQLLLIGAGEMGTIAVKALMKRGISNITIANRTYAKAAELAQLWGGQAVNFQQLPHALAQADIVITSTSAPHTVINKAMLEPVLAQRANHPLFIIDIALPRDVDPNVAELPNIYLYDIDDLEGQANKNTAEREAEIPQVEAIVKQELEEFMVWIASLEAKSTIVTLRQQMEQLRQQELERVLNRLDLDEHARNIIATMSQRLVNKILHQPTLRLKEETSNGNGAAYISTVRHLFDLDKAVNQ